MALLAIIVGISFGCGRKVAPESSTRRWIGEAPIESLNEDRVFRTQLVFDWQFGQTQVATQTDLLGWRVTSENADVRSTEEGLRLSSSHVKITLERDVAFAAAQVDAIRVTIRGVRGNARLYWRAAGDQVIGGNHVVGSMNDGEVMPSGQRRITLRTRSAPGWSGAIGGLRLVLPVVQGRPVVVARIEGLSYASSGDLLAAAADRWWKMDVDHEVRDARLALPGLPLVWPVEARGPGVLRFGYALTGRPLNAFEFRVSTRSGIGDDRVLWTDRLDPREDPGCVGVWRDAAVVVNDGPSASRNIVFEVASDGPYDPTGGWGLWSAPVLVEPETGVERPNVVLISIDTLRSDHLSLYGYQKETSPNLDRWAAQNAVVFENVVTQSPWTLPSHVSLFTGLNVTRHGVSHTESRALAHLLTMARRFQNAGYNTIAVTGGGYVHPGYGFSNGFDSYRYWSGAPPEHEMSAGLDRALHRLRGAWQPFFLFFHTYAVHGPYRVRQPFFSNMYPSISPPAGTIEPTDVGFFWHAERGDEPVPFGDVRVAEAMYDSGVAYVDDGLHRFLESLRETGVLDRSIVVFTSDHGEGLGEQGVTGHGYLKENNVLVPLVIAFPDRFGAGTRVASQGCLIDVLPTLLEATGLPAADDIDGTSLQPLIRDRNALHPDLAMTYAIARKGGVGLRYRNRLKYTFNNSAFEPLRGREALFDVVGDPGETINRIAVSPDAARLHSEVEALLEEQSGLRMRLANSGLEPIEGWIRGPLVQSEGVKSPDLECPCVTLEKRGELHVTVPPGRRYTLVFERTVPGDVEIEVRCANVSGGRPFHTEFDPASLDRGISIMVDRGQWRATDHVESIGAGIAVFWPGDVPVRTAESPLVDGALSDQLHALGYAE